MNFATSTLLITVSLVLSGCTLQSVDSQDDADSQRNKPGNIRGELITGKEHEGALIVCFDGTSNDDIIEVGKKSLNGETYDEGPTNVLLMHQKYLATGNQNGFTSQELELASHRKRNLRSKS